MDNYGILTLIPPVIVILFALWTKRTFEALLLGAIIGFFMTAKSGFMGATLYGFADTLAGDAWMFIVMSLLGSFVFLLQASKGAYGFGKLVQKLAKNEKRTLMTSWLLGIVIFIDDYLNILTISTSMMETCDQQKTPREMLAYVIDSTGAPVCVLIPLSSWAVFYSGVLEDTMGLDSGYGTGMEMYIHAIPYILYGWTAVIVVPFVILGIIPKVRGMKKAYKRVADGGNVYSLESTSLNEGLGIALQAENITEEEVAGGNSFKNIACFFIPLISIIAVTVVTMDLIIALGWTLVVMLVLYVPLKIVGFIDFWEAFAKGFAYMVPMNLIIAGALTLKTSMDGIGLPDFVIETVLPLMNVNTFPAITFIVVAGLSFITGSNWGIPALTVPIIIPLALAAGANPIIAFGAIVSGGTFGSHACFYSDATVLTSQSCRIKNLEHAFTQFPYALISASLAIVGYLIVGFAFQ